MKFYPLEVAKRGLTQTFIPIFLKKVNKYVDTRNVTNAVSSIPARSSDLGPLTDSRTAGFADSRFASLIGQHMKYANRNFVYELGD